MALNPLMSRLPLTVCQTAPRLLSAKHVVPGECAAAWTLLHRKCFHLNPESSSLKTNSQSQNVTAGRLRYHKTCRRIPSQKLGLRCDENRREFSTEEVMRVDQMPSDEGPFVDEILATLDPARGGVVLDLTFGSGGHTEKILQSSSGVKVIAVDRDPCTRAAAERLRFMYPGRLSYFNIKFSEVVEAFASVGIPGSCLSGAVLDAGVSQAQMAAKGRGAFSNTSSETLDFRMDGVRSKELSALEVLRHIDDESLYRILKIYGQNKLGRKISQALLQARYEMQNIRTPEDLNNVIMLIMGKDPANQPSHDPNEHELVDQSAGRIHPCATSTFQALRIFVNNEVNELDCAIKSVHYLLKPNAPFAVVTYNNLEDTIVKRHFTGINIDASVSTIGRPQHRHAKLVGLTEQKECRPWQDICKHLLPYERREEVAHTHSHWKNAKLRTAHMNPDVTYEIMK